jgi:PASTA domain-containing protein
MARRLASLFPRFVALPLVALLATGAATYAADKQLTAPQAPPQPTAGAVTKVVVVPDVRRQAFVFAKGTLEDAGFAWKVVGSVQGYAANSVVAQTPAAGTRVVDTGAPVVQVTLKANTSYGQKGSPENAPAWGTAIRVAGKAAPEAPAPAEPVAAAKPQPAVAKPKPAAKPKPVARTAAFVVAGAPKEPLDEMPLLDRARLLSRYIAAHPKRTKTAVDHFLYQHAWIVTGAEFGWWHGSQALEELVRIDERAQAAWGIGAKNETVARAALARVKAKSK